MSVLDKICNVDAISRETYGYDVNTKPNNHCYWNDYFCHWEENDEHLRNRIKARLNDE